MPAVTGYQAGLETTNTQLSYALESAWATLPSSTFQAVRIISESLKHAKTRSRPSEIRGDRQAAPPITTQETASGSVVMPVYAPAGASASPFEDWLACVLGSDWGAVTTITGVSGDIALNASSNLITSTTAGKFSGVAVGQVIKLNGFTNTADNTFLRVTAASGTSLTYVTQGTAGQVTETPAGAAAKVTISSIRNGTTPKTLYLQQRLNPGGSLWFRYPGAYPTRCQMALSLGQFAQATFDITAQQELKGTTDGSTGGIVAAPSTKVMDPVGGFRTVLWNDAALTSGVDQVSFDLNNDGAGGEWALGSSLAQGMLMGTLTGSAKFRAYFKDSGLYDAFRAETAGVFGFRMGDQLGNQYAFTFPNSTLLLENGVNVDGPNKALMAEFTVEASPDTTTGATVIVDRFAYTA